MCGGNGGEGGATGRWLWCGGDHANGDRQAATTQMSKLFDCAIKETDGKAEVRNELALIYQNQLLQNEHSSCHALLKKNKMEVLKTMFRLYDDVTMGLDHIANIFKEHIIDEGKALIQWEKDITPSGCALEEAFEVLLDEGVACRSIVALFKINLNKEVASRSSVDPAESSFCDCILKQVGFDRVKASQIMAQLEKLHMRSI
ncbi:unnamed protein product [Cuscuta campestris]|uniref:Cullin N-terminal domain-containing protein n=1 Tax=Cuscuta campestris TaxID=132261 RepID=A0A484LW94_9ASTE|nr:unnamed protein product [Cuscuta campestris]